MVKIMSYKMIKRALDHRVQVQVQVQDKKKKIKYMKIENFIMINKPKNKLELVLPTEVYCYINKFLSNRDKLIFDIIFMSGGRILSNKELINAKENEYEYENEEKTKYQVEYENDFKAEFYDSYDDDFKAEFYDSYDDDK